MYLYIYIYVFSSFFPLDCLNFTCTFKLKKYFNCHHFLICILNKNSLNNKFFLFSFYWSILSLYWIKWREWRGKNLILKYIILLNAKEEKGTSLTFSLWLLLILIRERKKNNRNMNWNYFFLILKEQKQLKNSLFH
jgi:hypothetical protein